MTGGVDNAAYSPSDAEMKEAVGMVSISAASYVTVGSRAIATVLTDFSFQMNQSENLYFQIVSRGTPTYTAADNLKVRVVLIQD